MGRMEAFFFYFTQDDNNSQRRGHLERNMQKGKTSDVNKIFFCINICTFFILPYHGRRQKIGLPICSS